MKFNKLILGAALVTPLFMGSCDSGTKIYGLTVEGYDYLYACSEQRVVNIRFAGNSCEFSDNISKDAFTWGEGKGAMQGIEISNIKKTASNNIAVTFKGTYNGPQFSYEDNLVKFKLSKLAFKNNKLGEDASGELHVFADKVNIPYTSIEDVTGNSLSFKLNFSNAKKHTGVSVNKDAVSGGFSLPISNYALESSETAGSIQINYDSEDNLQIKLTNLKDASSTSYHLLLKNLNTKKIFDNIVDDYGFKISVVREDDVYSLDLYESFTNYNCYIYSVED